MVPRPLPCAPGPVRRRELAVDYARRFVRDHESIDDEVWADLEDSFSDEELLYLTVFIARNLAFGRLSRVLRLDGG
jgi:alkylhydroperoxidase family enzyme